jgi:hypothetical protein
VALAVLFYGVSDLSFTISSMGLQGGVLHVYVILRHRFCVSVNIHRQCILTRLILAYTLTGKTVYQDFMSGRLRYGVVGDLKSL